MNSKKWIALIVGIAIIPLTIREMIVYPDYKIIELCAGIAGIVICLFVLFNKPTTE